jgi:hypothetical protein
MTVTLPTLLLQIAAETTYWLDEKLQGGSAAAAVVIVSFSVLDSAASSEDAVLLLVADFLSFAMVDEESSSVELTDVAPRAVVVGVTWYRYCCSLGKGVSFRHHEILKGFLRRHIFLDQGFQMFD